MDRRAFLVLSGGSCLAAGLRTQSPAGEPGGTPRLLATGCPIADPFCIKRDDGWYLAGTQHARGIENRRFSLFFSADLNSWRDLGPVLVRPQYEGAPRPTTGRRSSSSTPGSIISTIRPTPLETRSDGSCGWGWPTG